MKTVRCAIYTRKSSEEGLEQGFNSLDAQREACAAYILSQASEGWTLLPEMYDDGGISGGTLERPALQRLLGDIAAGRVDIIVVYKVDRLTRSLLDFSKLVEAFDKAGTSFVSITQSFNTTTSMGRLTLNMLLSFAQFEREVTAERIRDKIAASKAKGMWMGGTPPLGYQPDGRTLAIVEDHATLIQHIYQRYLDLGNVRTLANEMEREGKGAPRRVRISGTSFGGGALSRGQIYAILKNPIYAGDIAHAKLTYPGLHDAIIDRATWDRVQTMLAEHLVGERRATRVASPSLLAGLIVDEAGEPLIATHACKGKVRYRYYVSRSLHHGDSPDATDMRIPAREIEASAIDALATAFDDPLDLMCRASLPMDTGGFDQAFVRAGTTAARLRSGDRDLVRGLIGQVRVSHRGFEICVLAEVLAATLGTATLADEGTSITLDIPARLTRTGRSVRLVHNDGRAATDRKPDPTLLRLLVKARRWWSELAKGEVDIKTLASAEGVTPSYMTRIVRLAFLAPDTVEAILAGRQAATIDGKRLAEGEIAIDWKMQSLLFGTRQHD